MRSCPGRSGGSAGSRGERLRGKGRQPFSLPSTAETLASAISLAERHIFAHRVAPHFEAMRVVNQAVEDSLDTVTRLASRRKSSDRSRTTPQNKLPNMRVRSISSGSFFVEDVAGRAFAAA